MNRIHAGAAGLALAVTALAAPAFAADLTVQARPTAYVKYADLNLAHPAGVAQLNARVERAATRLCMTSGVQPVADMLDGRTCRDDAVGSASEQVRLAIAHFGNAAYAAASQVAVSIR